MSKYGSKTDHEGKAIISDGKMPVIVGECVPGNTISYFGLAKDSNGAVSPNVLEIKFLQSNGATFSKKFWDPTEDWAIANFNRDMLHICTKIVTEAEYYAVIEEAEDTFAGYVEAVKNNIISKAANMKFALKICYKENKNQNSASCGQFFPSFPNFPNWIEVDGTNPTSFRTNPIYDFYTTPEATDEEELSNADGDENSPTAEITF